MPPLTRKCALGGSAALLLMSCASDEPPSPSASRRPRLAAGLLNSILAVEHTAVAAYGIGVELLDGEEQRYARRIEDQERGHVQRLEGLIHGFGGTSARPRTPEEYRRSFPLLHGGDDFLRFASDLEQRLVRTYLKALQVMIDPKLRRVAAEIASDEGAHLGTLNVMRGMPAAPRAFVTGTL
jgi:rubrerythrin